MAQTRSSNTYMAKNTSSSNSKRGVRNTGMNTGNHAGTTVGASTRVNAKANAVYMYDNTARDLYVKRQLETVPRRQLSNEARKNRDKARHMSIGYVAFLVCALLICGRVLTNYIQLQTELTNKLQNIARLERELNSLRLDNDETYNRIVSSIDLEEIKRIAIGELGMTYAQEGQIITYSNVGSDYMRKVDTN